MNLEEFVKKYRVSNIYTYHEIIRSPTEKAFGWATSKDLDLSKPVVLSYPSTSKKFTEEDLKWSNEEGVSAVGIDDYRSYFMSLTGLSDIDFVDNWFDRREAFIEHWNKRYPDGILYETGSLTEKDLDYIYNLSKLLLNGERFIIYGRIFRLVNNDT